MEDKHLRDRRDDRSPDQFAEYLHVGCTKERAWAGIINRELRARGSKNCYYEDNGVDNTGAVINGRLANGNSDYAFLNVLENRLRMEIKHNWKWCAYQTFKVENLISYINEGACLCVPTEDGYHILGKTAMQETLRVCRHRGNIITGKYCVRAGIGTDPKSVAKQEKGGVEGREIGLISLLVEQGHILHRKWTPEASKFMIPLLPILRKRTSDRGAAR